ALQSMAYRRHPARRANPVAVATPAVSADSPATADTCLPAWSATRPRWSVDTPLAQPTRLAAPTPDRCLAWHCRIRHFFCPDVPQADRAACPPPLTKVQVPHRHRDEAYSSTFG